MKILKLLAFALLTSCSLCNAEVTRFKVRRTANLGPNFLYQPPVEKTLIIEQFIFTDAWKTNGEPMRVTIRHEGRNSTGTSINTTLEKFLNPVFRFIAP